MILSGELPKLENIKITRTYFTGPFGNVELQMFGYSFQDILSDVAFLRAWVTSPPGEIKTELAFVMGKARVTPKNLMTVLELELQAALLAARPKKEIIWVLSVTVSQVCLWTGSNTFLQWIKSNDKQLTFIARRVCKTLVYTSIDRWNQVASKDNTADAVTRGLIYVSRSHLTKASLIILNLLSTKQSLSKTLFLSVHLLKTDNYRFTVIPIWYVEFRSKVLAYCCIRSPNFAKTYRLP